MSDFVLITSDIVKAFGEHYYTRALGVRRHSPGGSPEVTAAGFVNSRKASFNHPFSGVQKCVQMNGLNTQ